MQTTHNKPDSCPTNISPFNIILNESPVMIHSPSSSKYGSGEQVTVSKMTFYHRIFSEFGELFDTPFSWEGIFIAGGFLTGLMETKYDPELYKGSDVDMYICADTVAHLRERVKYVVNYLQEHTKNVYFMISGYEKGFLIDCLIEGWKRRLQLIGVTYSTPFLSIKDFKKKSTCPTPEEVISTFDLTHCQIAFNGNIICTPEFVRAMQTRQTNINPQIGSVHAYRLVKAYLRGFSIGKPEHKVFIKNFFRRTYTKEDFARIPAKTDRTWHSHWLQQEFDELLKNPIVLQNLHKNFIVDFEHTTPGQLVDEIFRLHGVTDNLTVYNRDGYAIKRRVSIDKDGVTSTEKVDQQLAYHDIPDIIHMINQMSFGNIFTV